MSRARSCRRTISGMCARSRQRHRRSRSVQDGCSPTSGRQLPAEWGSRLMRLWPCTRRAAWTWPRDGEEATEEGVLEPSLQPGEDPPLPVLEVVFDALMMKDTYAQQAFGAKAAQVRAQLLESVDPCNFFRDELNLDTCLADRVQLCREFRCILFPLFASGGQLLPRAPPAEEYERVWATEAPDWSAHLTIPYPFPWVSEQDTDRLTQAAKAAAMEEHFPLFSDSLFVQRAEEEAIHARMHDYSRQSFLFLHVQPG
eukprot:6213203-Pleurochrysis_carterae.AAC.1